jgi:HSP20 family protein
MEAMENEFASAMERIFNPDFNGLERFVPVSNLAETDVHYEVTVELPGMKPEDFKVELIDGELWVTGERKEETEKTDKTFHCIERKYGEFRRVFKLPAAVDVEHVTAEYKEGILRITVPKIAEAKPRRVEVKA